MVYFVNYLDSSRFKENAWNHDNRYGSAMRHARIASETDWLKVGMNKEEMSKLWNKIERDDQIVTFKIHTHNLNDYIMIIIALILILFIIFMKCSQLDFTVQEMYSYIKVRCFVSGYTIRGYLI